MKGILERPCEKTMKRKPKRFSENGEDLRRGLTINEMGARFGTRMRGPDIDCGFYHVGGEE